MAQCVSLVQAWWRSVTLSQRRLHCILALELWRRWIWRGIDVSRCIFTTDPSDITKQRTLYDKSPCNSYAEYIAACDLAVFVRASCRC
jgi:hypothetical protein